MKKLLLLFTICLVQIQIFGQRNVPIIPYPKSVVLKTGNFDWKNTTQLTTDNLTEEMSKVLGFLNSGKPIKSEKPSSNNIFFQIDKQINLPEEGYTITISSDIVVKATNMKGIFYAVQTLLQLKNGYTQNNKTQIPAMIIEDTPRFAWRGMHLDVSRHFFTLDSIKRYIDLLAMHKMNVFHWHLTDDQGWRLEIKKYPLLTQIGGWRNETVIGHYYDRPAKYDGKKYGGFYTQEDAKEIVKYAAERYITVVPEIEMPGHAQAAIAAYPWLSCTDSVVQARTTWGVSSVIFNTKDSTMQFLKDVLTEVMQIFPSSYIHIGGDEAKKDLWKISPQIQKHIKDLNLKNEDELQSWFIKTMEKYLNDNGRKLVGWDEILEGGLAPNATVMVWRWDDAIKEALHQQHPVILCQSGNSYFDSYQAFQPKEPLAIGGFLSLEEVYAYEPIKKYIKPDQEHLILGGQANVWTEYIGTYKHVEYMAVPRMAASAEIWWSPKEGKDYYEFRNRLLPLLKIYKEKNINFCDKAFK